MTWRRVFGLLFSVSLALPGRSHALSTPQPPFYLIPGTQQVVEIRNQQNIPSPSNINILLNDLSRYPPNQLKLIQYVDVRPTDDVSGDPKGIIVAPAAIQPGVDPFFVPIQLAMGYHVYDFTLTRDQKNEYNNDALSTNFISAGGPRSDFATTFKGWIAGSLFYLNLMGVRTFSQTTPSATGMLPALFVAGLFADGSTQPARIQTYDGGNPGWSPFTLDSTTLSFGSKAPGYPYIEISLNNGNIISITSSGRCLSNGAPCSANGTFKPSAPLPTTLTPFRPVFVQKGSQSIQYKESIDPDGQLNAAEKKELNALLGTSGLPDAHFPGLTLIDVEPLSARPASVPANQNWDATNSTISLYLWDATLRAQRPADINTLFSKAVGARLFSTLPQSQKDEYANFLPAASRNPKDLQNAFADDYSNWVTRSSLQDALNAQANGDSIKLSRTLFVASFFMTPATLFKTASMSLFKFNDDQTLSAVPATVSRTDKVLKIGSFQISLQGFAIPDSLLVKLPLAALSSNPSSEPTVQGRETRTRTRSRPGLSPTSVFISPSAPNVYKPLSSAGAQIDSPHPVTEIQLQ